METMLDIVLEALCITYGRGISLKYFAIIIIPMERLYLVRSVINILVPYSDERL